VAGGIVVVRNDEFDIVDIDVGEDFPDDIEHSSRNENDNSKPTQDLYQKLKIPSLLIAIGLVGLAILIIVLLPRSENYSLERKINSLETRLKKVEESLDRLIWIEARLEQMEEKSKEVTVFMNTVERLGASSTQTTTKAAEAVDEVRYHQVRAGETLFGISRRYGLTVEELRRLNKLTPEATIHPEQKLLIRQGGSR
jgi:LysM repeat protein